MAVDVRINGADYPGVPAIDVPKTNNGGTARFYDTSGDTASDAQVLNGRKYHNANGQRTGTMAYHGFTNLNIADKSTVYLDSGYYLSVQAQISPAEQAKIVSENIKSGVTMLGVSGKNTVVDTEISTDAASAEDIASGKKAFVDGVELTGTAEAGEDLGEFLTTVYTDKTIVCPAASRFYGTGNVINLTLEGASSISSYAFAENHRIESFVGLDVTTIDSEAFSGAVWLETVRLPKCTVLQYYVFKGDWRLADVYLGSNTMCTMNPLGSDLQENAFKGVSGCKVHVPAALLSEYQANAAWAAAESAGQVALVGDYA